MRNISANGLATLAQRLGNEPIMIVEVDCATGCSPSSTRIAPSRFPMAP